MGFTTGVAPTTFKYGINISAPIDVLTMVNALRGPKGELILNGGYNRSWLVVGPGDNFKTTFSREINAIAVSRFKDFEGVMFHEYDDEGSYSFERTKTIGSKYPGFEEIINGEAKAQYGADDLGSMSPDEYFQTFKELCDKKAADKKNYLTYEAYVIKGKPIKLPAPNFYLLDSLSKFDSDSTKEYFKKNAGSGKDKNMIFMESGKYKKMFLMFLNASLMKSNSFMVMTGHLGKEYDLGGNMYGKKPSKILQMMADGETFKGIPKEATEMTYTIWYANAATKLATDGVQEYQSKYVADDKSELVRVRYTIYRNKFGKKDVSCELLFSQFQGYLRGLTDFHFLRTRKAGVEKDGHRFYNILMPDLKMFRIEVRDTIWENKLLEKACEFLATLQHLKDHRPDLINLYCTPQELYEDIKKLGYDWNVLLDTRSYVMPDQYNKSYKPYLSILDLLEVRQGLKDIWWYKDVIKGKWKFEKDPQVEYKEAK